MNEFEFETDITSVVFCREIAAKMVQLFGITETEAIGRINRDWRGLKLVGPNEPIYHEDEIYWANTIYFGKGSNWWLKPANLRPRSYP